MPTLVKLKQSCICTFEFYPFEVFSPLHLCLIVLEMVTAITMEHVMVDLMEMALVHTTMAGLAMTVHSRSTHGSSESSLIRHLSMPRPPLP